MNKDAQELLDFRKICKSKDQTLSKPKSDKLIDLLLTELEAHNLDDHEKTS